MKRKKLTTKEILSNNLARNPNSVLSNSHLLLHNIRSMHNVGAAFRTADGFGIASVILSGYSPVPPRPEISKTALGAEDCVPWSHTQNPLETFQQLRNSGIKIVCMEQTANSIPLPALTISDASIGFCFVFGNEVTGIDQFLIDQADYVVEIPQYGQKHSFNVSVSMGIALYSMLQKTWA